MLTDNPQDDFPIQFAVISVELHVIVDDFDALMTAARMYVAITPDDGSGMSQAERLQAVEQDPLAAVFELFDGDTLVSRIPGLDVRSSIVGLAPTNERWELLEGYEDPVDR